MKLKTRLLLCLALLLLPGCDYRQTGGNISCSLESKTSTDLSVRIKVLPAERVTSGGIWFVAKKNNSSQGFQASFTNKFGQSDGCGVIDSYSKMNQINIVATDEWVDTASTVYFYAQLNEKVVLEIVDVHESTLITKTATITETDQKYYLTWNLR